jgi:hypothetical protein
MGRGEFPVCGAIYTVKTVYQPGEHHEAYPIAPLRPSISLVEIVWQRGELSYHPGWWVEYFRKAGRGGMFDQLLVVDPEETTSKVLTPNPA